MNPNPDLPTQLLEIGPFTLLFIASLSTLLSKKRSGVSGAEKEPRSRSSNLMSIVALAISLLCLVAILSGHPIPLSLLFRAIF